MSELDDPVVVIGGGVAGHACVCADPDAGGDRPVVLLSADDRPPYFRPHVSKEYLVGDIGADELGLEVPDWYAANDVELVVGCEVTGIDLTTRVVSTTATDPLHWGHCVLATGAAAVRRRSTVSTIPRFTRCATPATPSASSPRPAGRSSLLVQGSSAVRPLPASVASGVT